jgi:hypothetical protein
LCSGCTEIFLKSLDLERNRIAKPEGPKSVILSLIAGKWMQQNGQLTTMQHEERKGSSEVLTGHPRFIGATRVRTNWYLIYLDRK